MTGKKDIPPDSNKQKTTGELVDVFSNDINQQQPSSPLDVPVSSKPTASLVEQTRNLKSGEEISLNQPLPSISVKLPSLGKMYPNQPNMPDSLNVRAMGMRQLMQLSTPALWVSQQAQPTILRECVSGLPAGMDVIDLLEEDSYALIMALRIVSYGRNYEMELECPKCDEVFSDSVDLEADLPTEYLENDPKLPIVIQREWLQEGKEVHIMPATWRQAIELDLKEDYRKQQRAQNAQRGKKIPPAPNSNLNQRVMDELETCVQYVEGIGEEKATIHQWLMGITAHDISIIQQMAGKYQFGMNLQFSPKPCPSCGSKFQSIVRITPAFFRATLPAAALDD